MYTRKVLLFTLALGLLPVMPAAAQVNLDLDIMSRFVWRGAEFGGSPSIQPGLSYTIGGLEVGTWAAIATTGDPDGYEVDWFAAYTFGTDAGDFTVSISDYSFPVPGEDYFSSDAHFVEAGLEYSGIAGTPFSLFGGVFLTDNDNNSVYLELGYDADPIHLFFGMTPAESDMYATSGPAVINVGFGSGRTVQVSDTFSFDISYDVILNPYAEDLFFLVGISF
ncbi:hypothetical protein QA596_12225 [Balneolales bacterium ANBcel1]|nr:hypothetical protein [Balneolales bacterium ANBcel1]